MKRRVGSRYVHNFNTCKRNAAAGWHAGWRLPIINVSGGKICRNLQMHGGILLCLQVPQLCTDLDLDVLYILLLENYGKFARQNTMIALGDESFRFHSNNFDEMPSKLESTENPRSSEKYPTPLWVFLNGCCTPAGCFIIVVMGCIMGTDQTLF